MTGSSHPLLARAKMWPHAWMRDAASLRVGEKLLEAIEPFLEYLVASGRAQTTLRRDFANLFLLGGEIVDRTHFEPALRRVSGKSLLRRFVDDEGGPLCRHLDLENHREALSYDATCRKLNAFLTRSVRGPGPR